MQQPIIQALRHHGLGRGLVYLNPTEPFNLYLEVGFAAGLFAASPFVFYQLWLFIAPGLYRNEKRYVLPFLLSTVGLFMAGGFFGYRMVYPASLDFLVGYGQRFQPMITLNPSRMSLILRAISWGACNTMNRADQIGLWPGPETPQLMSDPRRGPTE